MTDMGHAERIRGHTVDGSATFRSVYDEHYVSVLAYCGRRVGRSDAADAAADVFAVAWRRFDDIPRGDGTLPWLYGVAYRVVGRHWRSTNRRARLRTKLAAVAPPVVEQPDTPVVQREEYDLIVEAASRLRGLDQEVLRLAFWEELSHREIADVLQSTETAVRQRLFRARRSLRKEFERIGGSVPQPPVAQEGGVQ
jgi:RNA polymerase sigma-70 factor (ECF subfamily)